MRDAAGRAVRDKAAVIGLNRLRRTILIGAAGAASMAALLPGLALVRDTTGHDWYAAGKLVVTEAMIAAGFDPSAPPEYRAADGSVRRVTRRRVAHTVEAWQARSHILSTISDNALLGAGVGFAGTVLLTILTAAANAGRHERIARAAMEPTHRERRFSSHRGACIVEVLSRAEGRASIALLVAPAEFDRLAGTLAEAEPAARLPAAEPGRNSTKDTPAPNLPDATSACQEADIESSGPADVPDPDDVGRLPEQSAASSRKRASGRDGGSVGRIPPKRPELDDDKDWF